MMNKQSKIEKLITELCPEGVEFEELGKLCDSLKKDTLKTGELLSNGEFPVINSGRDFYGRYDKYNNNGNAIAIAARGEYAGFINYVNEKFWAGGLCYPYRSSNEKSAITKYIFYALKNQQQYIRDTLVAHGSIPALNKSDIDKFKIPIPPLAVQEEIVKILDNFTALEAELEAELEARKKQYEYYRSELLTFDDGDVEWKTLGEVAGYRRGSFPQPYGESRWYGGENAMPFVQVVDVGKNMRLVEDTKNKISKLAQPKSVFVPAGTVIVTLQGSIGRVAITQYDSYIDRTLAIFESFKVKINKKYFAYQLERKFGIEKENARGSTIKTITKEEFTKFKIPIPPLAEQNRVVTILDKFDALVNDISVGLPAELKARRQQYEYYRGKLLTFKEYAKQ